MGPVLRGINAQRLMLEYDDARSGTFESLAGVPQDKTVVLGLVTTKSNRGESVDELKSRIEDAARYFPLEQLALSPQCGFATSIAGNKLGRDDQERKLRTVVETALSVWGSAPARVLRHPAFAYHAGRHGRRLMTTSENALAHPISGSAIAAELARLGITHVIVVPDTIQRTLIAGIAERGAPELVPVATEDEAMAINAGLYMTGKRPMLLVQNTGFFASMNTLRAIAMEAQVPTLMFVGEFGRDVTKPNSESTNARVRVLEPTLDAWGVAYYRLDAPDDLPKVGLALNESYERRGPVIVLIGAPTS